MALLFASPGDAFGAAVTAKQAMAQVQLETRDVNRTHRSGPRDVLASSGAVYRRYGSHGYQFQPLASFGRVNALIDAGERREALALARVLIARAEKVGPRLYWEYAFGMYGARPRWTSGLTQAVAAQALARVGLTSEAHQAFTALAPKLLMSLPQGPWVRLYSFSDTVVLNAQLQTLLSLRQYATLTHDVRARELADALARSSRQLLPRFDTGWWSRYELWGGNAPIDYHRYVTALLWKLARSLGGGVWARQAQRFSVDLHDPPSISVLPPRRRVYLLSAGRNAQVSVVFIVSKPATLTVRVGEVSVTAWRTAGRHVLLWRPAATSPATVNPAIAAVDFAGNRTQTTSSAIHVRHDTTPPTVRVELLGNALFWRANDQLSPHLRGELVRQDGDTLIRHLAPAGVLSVLSGAAAPAWFLVADSSGNTTRIRLAGPAAGLPHPPPRLPPLDPPTHEVLLWIR